MSKAATVRRHARAPRFFLPPGPLLASLVCCACGSTDGTALLRPAGSSGGGGSGGASSNPSGGAGNGGSGGATVLLDAGPDAAPDASQVHSCRLLRAALVDAGVDAGPLDGGPYQCILTP